MSGSSAQLYEVDFVRWTEEQAAALREAAKLGTNLPLDWENLAEEIDSLGRSQRREVRSRITTIIEHLIKLECSPASEPRRGWMETIARERMEIELLLDDSPSLKAETAGMVAAQMPRAIRSITRTVRLYDEAIPEVTGKIAALNFTEDQVLGDWFPGDGPSPQPSPRERGEGGTRAARG
ncbi:MAG: DUF29 domain-containing protein [Alphaproteobacteria bacterium]|nr:DUF29 domain-containing protein [Alphaproteobacteria bacterium]